MKVTKVPQVKTADVRSCVIVKPHVVAIDDVVAAVVDDDVVTSLLLDDASETFFKYSTTLDVAIGCFVRTKVG